MKPTTFRRIALSLPEATEGSHFSNADFRIAGKIFATLALEHQGYGVLLLTRDQQAGMVQDAPEIFSPVPGGWGEKGATRVTLAKERDRLVATTTPHSSWALVSSGTGTPACAHFSKARIYSYSDPQARNLTNNEFFKPCGSRLQPRHK